MPSAAARLFLLVAGPALCLSAGCGTTRMSDTQRTATEQLLVSSAVDQCVSHFDFRPLAGKSVFFDPQYLDGTVDKGYVISSLRQQLLAHGCILQEERAKATYVVEARSGGVGTDRHSLLVGVPAMSLPTILPGLPSYVPKIPLAEKNNQSAVAKIAVFAYNRKTGRPVWQSGVVETLANARDTWLLGAGPFQGGTIRHGAQFAGHAIPLMPSGDDEEDSKAPKAAVKVTQAAAWQEPTTGSTIARQLGELLGTASIMSPVTIRELIRAGMAKLPPQPPPPPDVPEPGENPPPPPPPAAPRAVHDQATASRAPVSARGP
jgi:hypothetical protein